MQRFQILSILFLSLQSSAAAFQSSNSHVKKNSATVLHSASTGDASTSRRSFLDLMALAPLVVIPSAANASGGATAGGAYLLSAKQRYNERVKASVQGLLAVGDGLAGGSTTEAKAFFGSDDGGSWKDLTAAGYLLSNAFRRNSSSAPDSLPAVKKYKAFVKEVEALQKKLKKGATPASDTFPQVMEALEVWLSEIDLPPAKEL